MIERRPEATLEFGASDLAAMHRADLIGDKERFGTAAQAFGQIDEPMGVAQRRKREVGHHGGDIGGGKDPSAQAIERSRQVDNDAIIALAQSREQGRARGFVETQHLLEWLLAGEDRQFAAIARHGRGQQLAVDALGVLEGLAQAAARLEVEAQGDIAEMEVEVHERRAQLAFLDKEPSRGDRQRRRADAAARTDKRKKPDRPRRVAAARLGIDPQCRRQCTVEHLARYRLDEIIGNAQCRELAVKADIVDRPDGDKADQGAAQPGELGDGAGRIGDAGDIDEQNMRRRAGANRADRRVDAADLHASLQPAELGNRAADRLARHLVGDATE